MLSKAVIEVELIYHNVPATGKYWKETKFNKNKRKI